jgi:hypothetical protein
MDYRPNTFRQCQHEKGGLYSSLPMPCALTGGAPVAAGLRLRDRMADASDPAPSSRRLLGQVGSCVMARVNLSMIFSFSGLAVSLFLIERFPTLVAVIAALPLM